MRTTVSHWPEYLLEALGLGLFMVSACGFGVLLFHPASPVVRALPDAFARRALMGLAMGSTAAALIYSPIGRRSGAHFNPAVTLTFFHLGKVRGRDLGGYVAAQFIGGTIGVGLSAAAFGARLRDPAVHYVVTRPGGALAAAFVAEVAITFVLLSVVLRVANHPRAMRWAGVCAGTLVWFYITFEAPISGMSMNPARSLASALWARDWTAIWIFFLAPPLGMLAAAEWFRRTRRTGAGYCAKLLHLPGDGCIFCDAAKGPAPDR